MPEKSEKIFGIEGLAKYLDVPKSTLYKLAQEKKLPGQKVGKHWRFRQETIDAWLDAGAQLSDDDKPDETTPCDGASP
ncbi:helix-turn-helix domain-containing protein [Planctomycetota bacterium]